MLLENNTIKLFKYLILKYISLHDVSRNISMRWRINEIFIIISVDYLHRGIIPITG